MKYDFELDFINNNSLTWIMDQIKTGTTVLEFGPATGRLTKYMKEDLGCSVYLAEIDEEAGKKALQYAEDLVVGDVENYEWLEIYKDIRFDHIIFADVLEHLRNPESILVQAKRLLKADGSILLSVPNVAHNSVVINLLNNRFEYTSVGLLDNTHIHLFTKESLENMLTRAGLFIEQRYATYSKVGTNEIPNTINDVSGIDKSFWLSRDYGEVYQFVYAVRKSQEYVLNEANELLSQNRNYFAQIFYDSKNPCEDMTEKRYWSTKQRNHTFVFEGHKLQKTFRFDPVDNECFLRIHIEGADVISHNACIKRDEIYMFNTPDPIIELEKKDDDTVNNIIIQVEYISIDTQVVKDFADALVAAKENESLIDSELKKRVEQLEIEFKKVEEIRNQLLVEKNQLGVNFHEQLKEISLQRDEYYRDLVELKEKFKMMSSERESFQAEIEAYKLEKEQVLEEKNQLGADFHRQIEELNASVDGWAKLCHEKDRIIDDIMHSRKWRLINMFRIR